MWPLRMDLGGSWRGAARRPMPASPARHGQAARETVRRWLFPLIGDSRDLTVPGLQKKYCFPRYVAVALTGSNPDPSRGPQTAQTARSSATSGSARSVTSRSKALRGRIDVVSPNCDEPFDQTRGPRLCFPRIAHNRRGDSRFGSKMRNDTETGVAVTSTSLLAEPRVRRKPPTRFQCLTFR